MVDIAGEGLVVMVRVVVVVVVVVDLIDGVVNVKLCFGIRCIGLLVLTRFLFFEWGMMVDV